MTLDEKIDWYQFNQWGNEVEYVNDALKSNWVSGGEYIHKLEKLVTETTGIKNALAVSNGTSALQLAFLALDISYDDEVIVPGYGFLAASNVLIQMGAVPIFVDVSLDHWNLDGSKIQEKITRKTKAILVIHNYGVVSDIVKIASIAKENNLFLIEDCAEAMLSTYNGQSVGSFGDIGTFSLHATKTISCGEGGVVVCKRDELYEKMLLIRSHGLRRKEKHYWHEIYGNNFRLSNVLAAIAVAQFEEYECIIKEKLRVYQRYYSALNQKQEIVFQKVSANSVPVFWAIAVYIDFSKFGISRDDLMEILLKHGIETRPGFYPPDQLPIYSHLISEKNENSCHLASGILSLPSSPHLENSTIDKICQIFMNCLEKNRVLNLKTKVLTNTPANLNILSHFLQNSRESSRSFRYFINRGLDAISAHVLTVLFFMEGEPVAYGHLDKEKETIWLGVCVADGYKNRGLGKKMVDYLLEYASEYGIERVHLRVDSDNLAARHLYESCEFIVEPEELNHQSVLMYKDIKRI